MKQPKRLTRKEKIALSKAEAEKEKEPEKK